MNSSWNLGGDASTYQKYQKGWANESPGKNPAGGYQRKNQITGQATIKSGVMSSDNPFGHMTQYYDRPASPRQSLANLKHISEKRGDYNEITG